MRFGGGERYGDTAGPSREVRGRGVGFYAANRVQRHRVPQIGLTAVADEPGGVRIVEDPLGDVGVAGEFGVD